MSSRIVQCVINICEGRNQDCISAVTEAIQDTHGCTLLDVDSCNTTNRTVYTFVGDPYAVVHGALCAARVVKDRIDMRTHQGSHPRIGAMDVVPFVPIANVSMETCVNCANEFARQLASELGMPSYLYEYACTQGEHRRTLRQLRGDGEYEGLEKKLQDPKWAPDYGSAKFIPEWGVTAVGARNFLIAYNVNILSTEEHAHRLALNLREQGRNDGQPGKCRSVNAIGWYVEELKMAQVSMNLEHYEVTGMHQVIELCKEEAAKLGVAVAGSEIIGMVPLRAVLMAADFYIQREGLFVLDQDVKIRLAVERLGLSSIKPFVPSKRIIDLVVSDGGAHTMANISVRRYIEAVASRSTC
eukprot:RCo006661